MTGKQHNDLLLDIIIPALEGYAQERRDGFKPIIIKDAEQDNGKFSYLLGQAIRHWIIPVGNWHTSEAAMMVWNMIVDKGNSKHKEINHLRYKEPILLKDGNIMIPRFKGSTRDFAKLDPHIFHGGKQYAFNEIFVAEHTTPVVDIMIAMTQCYDELDKQHQLDDMLKQEVEKILDKIHITQMLRIEDRRINTTQARIQPFLLKRNMNNVYHYLLDSKNDVYKDMWESYYRNLEKKDIKITCSNRKYSNILQNVKDEYNGAIPDWAEAIDLVKQYTINIYPKNPNEK